MNFTYTLYKPPDGQYGAIQADGSWNGMISMLQKETIDIAPAPFSVTRARASVMTYATPINNIYHALFIKNPSETFNYSAYTEPMHWSAWVGLLVMLLIVPPSLWFGAR